MPYAEEPFPPDATDAFSRFWDYGIRITEIGSVGFYGSYTAQKDGRFDAQEYDFKEFSRNLNEMIFARALDNFQSYIVELLIEIFDLRPETVPKGQISYRELFSTDDVSELRKLAIERTVSSYGYMNIVDLSTELQKTLKFELFTTRVCQLRVRRLVEIRNIIVHNRSVVNRIFAEKAGSRCDTVGQRIKTPLALRVLRYLDQLAIQIDNRANEKFELRKYRNG